MTTPPARLAHFARVSQRSRGTLNRSNRVNSHDRLVAVEPGPGRVFRANLVVTVMGNGALSFRDWQASTDRGWRLVPTDATAVWRRFTTLLPAADPTHD